VPYIELAGDRRWARSQGCGRQPFQEQPERFNELAADFLAAAGARSREVSG
jgi:hypothetical protein